MKKIFKTLAVLAAVAALGFSFVSCKNNDDDSSNNYGAATGNNGSGNGGNSTTAVTKETIAPKNFKVEQVEGQNKLRFTWEAGTVVASTYTLTNKTKSTPMKIFYGERISSTGETSYTIDWCNYVGGSFDIALDSGEYEFTLVASKWSKQASATIETDPISAKVNFEAKLLKPTVPENIKAYQTNNYGYDAILNFDEINNNGNYWLWYVSTTNDINKAAIRAVTDTSIDKVAFSYEKYEVPPKGTTVYVWIKSALKIIDTEGNELKWKWNDKSYYLIKADSDTYSAPTEPFTFVWNIDK